MMIRFILYNETNFEIIINTLSIDDGGVLDLYLLQNNNELVSFRALFCFPINEISVSLTSLLVILFSIFIGQLERLH